jgi:hypothetical protein
VPIDANSDSQLNLVDQVDGLSEEVKVLALNLAIYLAKAKSESEELSQLEPEFIRLVNGTVLVLQEIGRIISAARNAETMVYDVSSGQIRRDQIEVRLRSILDQCGRIMRALSRSGRTPA